MNFGLGFGRLARRTPLLWHLPNQLSRIEVIQSAIDRIAARRYLEVGVSTGECFCALRVTERTGVDPAPAAPAVAALLGQPGVAYHEMTSDRFFATTASTSLSQGIDVAFIDGLHTDRQAYEDCLNAMRFLTPGGLVFMHDNLPVSATEAVPAESYAEAKRLSGPAWHGEWTGDAWKAIVRLRAGHPELSAAVLNCDHGVAVVWKAPARRVLALKEDAIDRLTYEDLLRDPRRLLGLCAPVRLDSILEACRTERGLP